MARARSAVPFTREAAGRARSRRARADSRGDRGPAVARAGHGLDPRVSRAAHGLHARCGVGARARRRGARCDAGAGGRGRSGRAELQRGSRDHAHRDASHRARVAREVSRQDDEGDHRAARRARARRPARVAAQARPADEGEELRSTHRTSR